MSRPIVFVDTETTGLSASARPWEVAVIRRERDGAQREYVAQIAYDLAGMAQMHASEQALAVGGWLTRGAPGTTYLGEDGKQRSFRWRDERQTAMDLRKFFVDEPVLIGVDVHFDARILEGLFSRGGTGSVSWHYALVDLKAATWGHLLGQDAHNDLAGVPMPTELHLPLRSEELSRALGVEPPAGDERHTALGDARWAARWYDALTGGGAA